MLSDTQSPSSEPTGPKESQIRLQEPDPCICSNAAHKEQPVHEES